MVKESKTPQAMYDGFRARAVWAWWACLSALTIVSTGCQVAHDAPTRPRCSWFGNAPCQFGDIECASDRLRSAQHQLVAAFAIISGAEQPDGSFREWVFADPRRGPDAGPFPKLGDVCDAIGLTGKLACEAVPGMQATPGVQAALGEVPANFRKAKESCQVAIRLYEDGRGYDGDRNLRAVGQRLLKSSRTMSKALDARSLGH